MYLNKNVAEQDCSIDRTCIRCGKPFAVFRQAGDLVHPNCLPQKCEECRAPAAAARKSLTCQWCFNPFVQQGYSIGRIPQYCCSTCRTKAGQARAKERDQERRPKKPCDMCGAPLEHGGRKLCDTCKVNLREVGIIKQCDDCGADFTTKRLHGLRCVACAQSVEKKRIQRTNRERVTARLSGGAVVASTAKVAARGEMMFDLLCIAHGIEVVKGVIDCQPNWDRIVVLGGRTIKVQIKSLRGERFAGMSSWRYRPREKQIAPDVDVVAVIDVSTATVIVCPAATVRHSNDIKPREWKQATFNAVFDYEPERLTAAFAKNTQQGGAG